MKTKSIYILALLIPFIIGFQSCYKADGPQLSERQDISQTDSEIVLKKIEDFKEKLDFVRITPGTKSGFETIDIITAEWHVEALANYMYADAGFDFEHVQFGTASVSVPLTDGEVSFIHLLQLYDELAQHILNQSDAINSDNKQLIVADVFIEDQQEDIAVFGITSGFAIGGPGFGWLYNSPWYWGWDLGRCDGSGTGAPLDAADIIRIQANIEVPTPAESFYTDVSFFESFGCLHQNQNGDCFLFEDFQEFELIHACLSPAEITMYKNNVHTLANMHKPSNKTVVLYDVWDDTAFALCGTYPNQYDCWFMVHFLKVTYGIWHQRPIEQ